jgi:hypothetical protein
MNLALWLILILLLPTSTMAGLDPDREENCGWGYEVKSYSADIDGHTIEMPSFGHLLINGKTLVKENERPWYDSHNAAKIGRIGNEFIIIGSVGDCIDLRWSIVYIVDKMGNLRAHNQIWTEHYKDGFYKENDSIIYWSEWFCSEFNKARIPGMTYVYTLKDGSNSFTREDRDMKNLCPLSTNIKVNSAWTTTMKPTYP